MSKAWNPMRWPSRLALRYVTIALAIFFLTSNYWLWHGSKFWDREGHRTTVAKGARNDAIRKLMVKAKAHHDALLAKRSHSLESAAAAYRLRRGRHPPPGFDLWFQGALNASAVVVEDFFDRIYKDLTPFWALDAPETKRRANTSPYVVRVRNGTCRGDGDTTDRVPWLQLWTALVEEMAPFLPDVDMPINYMDEPRLLVPFDQVAKLVKKEAEERKLVNAQDATTKYEGLSDVDSAKHEPHHPKWFGPSEQYWHLFVKTCGPDTPAYGTRQLPDWSGPAQFPKDYKPAYSYKGYIQNFTASLDPCLQPHLRHLHGSFIEPISLSATEELIPLFGGSKLAQNNEILIPGAMYLDKGDFYSGGESHGSKWERKKVGVVWRGESSGGRAKEHNWHHFHRQRLVHMLNATVISQAEETGIRPKAFDLPLPDVYPSARLHAGNLGPWIGEFANAGFVSMCSPEECPFFVDAFSRQEHLPMKKQYEYKFLPDVDGNSFSARFRGFLRSTSLPLKATVYVEWHDDRLTPWVHFVPLDNTFRDLLPVLDYFSDNGGPGDEAARFIAEQGQEWSEAVLRREDMRLYVWRLLLEWARVCDENRHRLGYVEDLLKMAKAGA